MLEQGLEQESEHVAVVRSVVLVVLVLEQGFDFV